MASQHYAPSRRVKRRYLFGLAALVAALGVAVPLAWASHGFTDVPDANPFHTEISNLAGSGITAGKTCVPPGTPPTFCPNEPVVRQSMAAFLNRGLGRVGYDPPAGALVLPVNGDAVVLGSVTLNIGGAAGGTQFVKVDAAVSTYIISTTGCPCSSLYALQAVDIGQGTVGHVHTNIDLDPTIGAGRGQEVGGVTGVFAVPTASTQTFNVVAGRTAGGAGEVRAYANLTAITAPFGSTGSSTLGAGASGASQAPLALPPTGS
jgi:hypothetical protein